MGESPFSWICVATQVRVPPEADAFGAASEPYIVEVEKGAIQRFAENDPASARARLSNIFVLERGHKPPEPSQAIGTTEGRLVISGVLVRGKR